MNVSKIIRTNCEDLVKCFVSEECLYCLFDLQMSDNLLSGDIKSVAAIMSAHRIGLLPGKSHHYNRSVHLHLSADRPGADFYSMQYCIWWWLLWIPWQKTTKRIVYPQQRNVERTKNGIKWKEENVTIEHFQCIRFWKCCSQCKS